MCYILLVEGGSFDLTEGSMTKFTHVTMPKRKTNFYILVKALAIDSNEELGRTHKIVFLLQNSKSCQEFSEITDRPLKVC